MDRLGTCAMVPDASVRALFEARRGKPAVDYATLSLEAARANFAAAQVQGVLDGPELARIREISDSWDNETIRLRHYRHSDGPALQATLVFFHGGGWVFGGLDSHDQLCRVLASAGGLDVISVDYPLSPETRYPGAVRNGLAALRWIFSHAQVLGIDTARIAVGGDSAGGNLAAVMALHARNGDLPPLKAQVLFYPLLDLTMSGASYANALADLPVSASAVAWYIRQYLPCNDVASHWQASPLLAESVADLCPAYILVAGCDVIASDGIAYAERLRAEGVSLVEKHYPGQIHAFLTMPHMLPEAVDAWSDIAAYLARHVSQHASEPVAASWP